MGSLDEKFSTAGTGTTILAWIKIVNAKLQLGFPTSGLDPTLNGANFLNEHAREVAMRTATHVPHTDNMQESEQLPSSPATSNNPNNPVQDV